MTVTLLWDGFGGQKGAKMRPNFDPRRTKIDVKNKVEERRLLKIVLDPSWVDLGSSWVPSWGQNRALALGGARFSENRLFGENEGSRGDLRRSWIDLGAQSAPKWHPKTTPKRSKTMLKTCLKFKSIFDRKWMPITLKLDSKRTESAALSLQKQAKQS